jgi:cytochrome P450
MPDTEVRSNLLTFISAGHETTANALTWSLFLLSQASDWRRRVEDEVLTVGDSLPRAVDRLVLTRAVIEEAIRLYPPIAALSRVAGNEDRLVGETVEAGTLIVIAPFVLHRHRIHWSDPDVFNPARFLPSVRGRINRFTYLPFGAGARTCIGSTFALQEAVIVLASIVQHFEFALATQRVRPTLRVTLRPADGLPMLIRRRHEVVNQLVTSGSGRLTASLGSRPDTSRAADFGRPS